MFVCFQKESLSGFCSGLHPVNPLSLDKRRDESGHCSNLTLKVSLSLSVLSLPSKHPSVVSGLSFPLSSTSTDVGYSPVDVKHLKSVKSCPY